MSNLKNAISNSAAEITETKSNPPISMGEIVLYQPEGEIKLEVRVENETVWLTQAQMAEMFKKDRTVISRHIKNVYKEGELEKSITCANFAHVGSDDDQIYNTTLYNIDVIISVGYRIKSIQGTRFRQWANRILKDYMLKGYAINQRRIATDLQIANRLQEQKQLIENQETRINNVDNRLSAVEQHIDFFVKATQLPSGGVLAPNTRFNGYVLIADLVKSAKRSIVFIDPFADISVLKFAAMKAEGVSVTIYSARISHQFKEEAALYKKQHPEFDLRTMRIINDRFLLVDDTVYHFGASFKDMGAEFSAYSVLNFVTPEEVIEKVKEITKGL